MDRKLARFAIVLGLITAGGGLGIDMYLPAFPAIAQDFRVEVGAVQMSLVVYLLAIAAGQLLYGPVSDMVGRRAPMVAGLVVYAGASIGCALATNIEMFIGFRLLQGLGACAGMVITRAVVRDCYTGPQAIKLQSLIMAVVGVSPIASPVLGGIMTQTLDWSSVFFFLAATALLAASLAIFALPETHPRESRSEAGVTPTLKTYLLLSRDRRFMGLSLIPGLTQGGTFAFVSSSSFLFIELFGATPAQYSLIFAGAAVFMIGGAQFAAMAVRRFGTAMVVLTAICVDVAGGLLITVATFGGFLSLPIAFVTFLCMFGSLGFIGGPASVKALEPHGERAGAASALSGAMSMAWGAAGGAVAGALFNGTAGPIALALLGFASAGLVVAIITLAPDLREAKAEA